ncbi:MAG TPA: hypothetical protein VN630_08095 [Rhodanobacteraceae bacterium]|nr:hypothetical protein [Rhodanobacteraceae bacterium]
MNTHDPEVRARGAQRSIAESASFPVAGIMEAVRGQAPTHDAAAAWLHLAATPVFAAVALLATFCGDPLGMPCGGTHGVSLFSGMPLMYALMGVVHSAPWLNRFSRACIGLRNMMSGRRMALCRPADGSADENSPDGTDGLSAHRRGRPGRRPGWRFFAGQYFSD